MSHVYDVLPGPDWAGTTSVNAPGAGRFDAATWAREIFDVRSAPGPVKVLMGMRELLVRLVGIPPGDPSKLAVDRVEGDEAIIDTDDAHLHFAAGVSADAEHDLVHVVTVVRFKGVRGRAYFLPVRLLHDPVTRAMMRRAAVRLGCG